jgi:hypothetical protein
MEEYLELVENPGNYYRRQRSVMKKAAALRRQGYDSSTALSMAWGNQNPTEASFAPSAFTWLLLAGGAFTLIWYFTKHEWWWQAISKSRIGTNRHRSEVIVP